MRRWREVTDEEMRVLRARATQVHLDLPTFERFPMTVHDLPDRTLLVESLYPSIKRPHVHIEDRSVFDLWLAQVRGVPSDSLDDPTSHSEDEGLFVRIAHPEYPKNLLDEMRKLLGGKPVALDFSRASIRDLMQIFSKEEPDEFPEALVGPATLYVLESVRRAVGGTWDRVQHFYGEDLAIRTPDGRVLDFTVDLILNLHKWCGYLMLDCYDAHSGRKWHPQRVIDDLMVLDLMEDSFFPDHLPPLLRMFLGNQSLVLKFDREGVRRLSRGLLRRRLRLKGYEAGVIALFVIEAARYATGREWLSNVVEGPLATIRGFDTRDFDYAALIAEDLEETGGMNLVAIYDRIVSGEPADL